MCVSLKTVLRRSLLWFSFQRTVHTAGIVFIFQRTIGIPSALKRNKFYTAGILKVLYREQFLPHLTALRLRTNLVAQVLCFTKVNL